MSIDSTDYKVFKYTSDNGSVNHPSFDKESMSSLSSLDPPPSRTKSALANVPKSNSSSQKATSFKSEPTRKKSVMPLTEQALAIHNSIILQYPIPVEEEEEYLEQSLFDKVNERCNDIQQDFEEKIKQLEAQFAKAEFDYNESRNELKELSSMEKEYLNQGIQTELCVKDINHMESELSEWKSKAEGLKEFVDQSKKIIWDTSFIPINSICRQLPTQESDDDEDICDYHRDKIEKYKLKSDKERNLYLNDNNATLNRISNWSNTIKHY